MIVLVLVASVIVGAASIILLNGSIDGLLSRYLLPLTVACAAATASGESDETRGLLVAGFIVMVTLRAIDESPDLELPVIWLSILAIIATFGDPVAVAQVASASMIVMASQPKYEQPNLLIQMEMTPIDQQPLKP